MNLGVGTSTGSRSEFSVGGKYHVLRKIGSGSFGEVYLAMDVMSSEEVAVKVEPHNTRHPNLLLDSSMYKILQGGVGIPHMRWFRQERDRNMLVMDLPGHCPEDLSAAPGL